MADSRMMQTASIDNFIGPLWANKANALASVPAQTNYAPSNALASVMAGPQVPVNMGQMEKMVYDAAIAEGVPPALFLGVVKQESSFRPEVWEGAVRSGAGAIGPSQLMPGTASDMGVNPYDVEQNLRGGARYLKQQLDRFGDPRLAVAAYNAGPGRVQRAGGVPQIGETMAYVPNVLRYAQQYGGL